MPFPTGRKFERNISQISPGLHRFTRFSLAHGHRRDRLQSGGARQGEITQGEEGVRFWGLEVGAGKEPMKPIPNPLSTVFNEQ